MSLDLKFKDGFFGKNENATKPLKRLTAQLQKFRCLVC
ncbi:hypothetical protein LEP1GSC035_0564 [Leptospira noguchii str. 2007001578]|uniref:Uncharacterized protein n=1 Tax=Leptospira noguchii str. 2007001578 TaxID=1049974 RepID=A0ABN0IVX5_9LEPT|nr:hypothetical protein LEP1GSC035_0564 [Leptospira noguchii str. 2007001578]